MQALAYARASDTSRLFSEYLCADLGFFSAVIAQTPELTAEKFGNKDITLSAHLLASPS